MLGKHYLCAVVTQEEASWPTPCAMEAEKAGLFNKGQMGQSLSAMANRGELHGQAAPANWPTPIQGDSHLASTPEAAARRLAEGKSTLSRLVESGQAAPASSNTLGSRQELWPTASVPNGGQTTSGRADKDTKKQVRLEHAVKQWGSPAANDANKQNVLCEVNSNQAGLAKSVGLELQRQWATPRTPTGGPESAQRKQELGRTTSGGGDLASQAMTQWGSPRTGIRGDTHFSYDRGKHNIEEQAGASMKGGGKLNPRWVETLMGLPIGWTIPSCIRPVTIELTSCDSSGMALCQPAQSERSDFLLASCGKEPTK